jgi:hypothetical protein
MVASLGVMGVLRLAFTRYTVAAAAVHAIAIWGRMVVIIFSLPCVAVCYTDTICLR